MIPEPESAAFLLLLLWVYAVYALATEELEPAPWEGHTGSETNPYQETI